jgi:hypothetical protein
MKQILVFFPFVMLFIVACKKNETVPTKPPIEEEKLSEAKDILEFRFKVADNPQQLLKDVKCRIYDDRIVGIIPYLSSDKRLVPSFTISGKSILIEDSTQQSGLTQNDFQKQIKYKVKAEDGSVKEYTVTLFTFTGLPIFYLDSEKPIATKTDWVKGKIVIDPNSAVDEEIIETAADLRGRGNSTWAMAKKPYRFKLPAKMPMLGMPADKKWSLLANFSDKTMMRNMVAFEIGRLFEVPFTPRNKPVEVILNGEYIGNYLLIDQVEVGKNRVNIPELDANATDISGGYLMEIDSRLDEPFWFRTTKLVPVTIKSPEDITPAQLDYIHTYVQETENVLFSANFADPVEGYAKYLDVESFINWYLVNELTKNNDAIFYSSVFMHKHKNGKLAMGPIWDFDIALGNVNYNDNSNPAGWWVRKATWYAKLFQDPVFAQKVKDRWNVLKGEKLNSIFNFINTNAKYLSRSQKENFAKWDVLYNYTWPNAVMMGSYENEVQYMKEWLIKRIAWMDQEFNNMQ